VPTTSCDLAVAKALLRGALLGGLLAADEQIDCIAGAGENSARGEEMLHGENFGGGHERDLKTVFDDDGGGFQGHDGFSAAHVALEQAVHGRGALEIGDDFGQHALLRFGGLEGEHALERLRGCADRARGRRCRGDARLLGGADALLN
jgi:hypothetical protein